MADPSTEHGSTPLQYNGGGEGPLSADLSWLAGTFRRESDDRLWALNLATALARRTGCGSSLGTRPLGHYGSSVVADDGAWAVGWDGRGDAERTVLLEVRQSALEDLGRAESVRLASEAVGDGFRASRVDLVAVDASSRVRPRQLLDAWRRGEAVTRVRTGELREDVGGPQGLFVGARASDRYGRFYEGRATGVLRLETESKRARAAALAAAIAEGSDPTDLWAAEVRGLIDWPRLDAWASLFA